MDRTAWIEHRRGDGERVGWIRPEGEDFVPIDLLGRELGAPTDWLSAEESLEHRGLGWLAEPWALTLADGAVQRVRIVEVTPERIRVKNEDWGDVARGGVEHVLPFPAPATLEPWANQTAETPFGP